VTFKAADFEPFLTALRLDQHAHDLSRAENGTLPVRTHFVLSVSFAPRSLAVGLASALRAAVTSNASQGVGVVRVSHTVTDSLVAADHRATKQAYTLYLLNPVQVCSSLHTNARFCTDPLPPLLLTCAPAELVIHLHVRRYWRHGTRQQQQQRRWRMSRVSVGRHSPVRVGGSVSRACSIRPPTKCGPHCRSCATTWSGDAAMVSSPEGIRETATD